MNFLFIKKHFLVSLFIAALIPFTASAQKIDIDASAGVTEDGVDASVSITIGGGSSKTDKNSEANAPLPVAYRDISLGMNIDDVKQMLLSDKLYG